MNIRCPSCNAVFRVDPARIAPAGVRARCSRCSAAFMIRAPGPAAAPPAAAPSPSATAAAAPAAPSPGTASGVPTATTSAPAGAVEAAPGRAPVFGTKDPHARAQRIARALVSDIVAYHPRKREDSLANGTMRSEFREEIMKSWEEYVAQVGNELAKSTPYFRNALNDILAKGQRIF